MITTKRLLQRCKPKSDESFIGYLVRLTEQNYYDAPSWILELASAKYRQNCIYDVAFKTEGWLGNLADLTNNEEHELASLTFPSAYEYDGEPVRSFFGHPLYNYLIRPDRPKVCPDCLKQFGYCRGMWDMMLVTACPLHNKLLIDECPRCHHRIPYLRKHVSLCSCNYDFRSAPTLTLNDEDVGLARQLHRLCGAPFTESATLQQANPLRMLQLIELATAVVFVSIHLKGLFTLTGKKVVRSKNSAQLHGGFTEAYKAFDKFPYNYYEVLEQCQRRDEEVKQSEKGHKNGLGRCFGNFYEGLDTHLTAPCFNFMHTSFNEYIRTLWGEGNSIEVVQDTDLANRTPVNYVTCNAARRQLRASKMYIKHLVSTHQLQAITRKTSKKETILINFDSLMQVKREHEGALNSTEVGKQLGISSQVVVQLVSKGCLSAICAPKPNNFSSWKFRDVAAEQLLTIIRSKIIPCFEAQNAIILDFRSVCRKLLNWKIKVSYFVKSILIDKIKPHSENHKRKGLHRFTFLLFDLNEYLRPYIDAYYSKHKIGAKITFSVKEFTNFRKASREWKYVRRKSKHVR